MLHVVDFLVSPKIYSYPERAEMKLSAWISSAPSYSGRKRTSSRRNEGQGVISLVQYDVLHFAKICSLSRDIYSRTINKGKFWVRKPFSPIFSTKSLRKKRGRNTVLELRVVLAWLESTMKGKHGKKQTFKLTSISRNSDRVSERYLQDWQIVR